MDRLRKLIEQMEHELGRIKGELEKQGEHRAEAHATVPLRLFTISLIKLASALDTEVKHLPE